MIKKIYYSNNSNAPVKPVIWMVHGGFAAMNPGADYVQPLAQSPLAPEQGAGPVTANFSIKLRLLEKPTAPVSTGIVIGYKLRILLKTLPERDITTRGLKCFSHL